MEFKQQIELTGLRALVVDDQPDDRLMLTVMLELFGLQVSAVASVAAALSCLTEVQPDLLLSDLAMPYEDGYTLIRQVRLNEIGRAIPAIAISALSASEERHNSLSAGFHACVTKPIDPQALFAAIRQTLMCRQQTA